MEKQLHLNYCLDQSEVEQITSEFGHSTEDDDFRQIVKSPLWCQICSADISCLSLPEQTKHIDACCKSQELESQEWSDSNKETDCDIQTDNVSLHCSACGISLKGKSSTAKINHFKKCHKKNKTSISELKKIRAAKDSDDNTSSDSTDSSKSKDSDRSRPKPSKRARTRKPIEEAMEAFSPPTVNTEFMAALHKAHYRPQPKVAQSSPVGPSPPGPKDLAGFALTQRSTQIRRKEDTEECLKTMFSDEDSIDLIDLTPPSRRSSQDSASPLQTLSDELVKSHWKLSKALARPSQYRTSLLLDQEEPISQELELDTTSPTMSSPDTSSLIAESTEDLDELVDMALDNDQSEYQSQPASPSAGSPLPPPPEPEAIATTPGTSNLSDYSSQLLADMDEINKWYEMEIEECEKQKQKAILELETTFFAQVGRIALARDSKLKACQQRHLGTSVLFTPPPPPSPGVPPSRSLARTPPVCNTPSPRPRTPSQVRVSPSVNHTPTHTPSPPAKRPLSQSESSLTPLRKKARSSSLSQPQATESPSSQPSPTSKLDPTATDNPIVKALNERISESIRDNTPIWTKVLLQQTIDIVELQTHLRTQNVKCGLQYLSAYLRAEGVTFRKPKKAGAKWGKTKMPSR